MIHQLICERQNCDRAVVVTTLRTVRYGNSSDAVGVPAYAAVTSYYVVSRELASVLTKTDLFYSSDTRQEDQISLILQDKVPDIIRRREQIGRARETAPSPEELENDLLVVFGKHGGPMPVYRFICDEAAGGIMLDKDGVRQVMRGVWSGRDLPAAKSPTPREVANSVPTEGAGKLDFDLPSGVDPEKCMVFDEPAGARRPGVASDVLVAVRAAFPEIAKRTTVNVFDGVDGKMRLVILVKGGVSDDVKLRLSNFLAEYGCLDPEETFSADGDWAGVFDFRPERDGRALCESSDDPVSVVIRAPGESDRECRLGSSRKMQDLSTFDGGEVVRVFAVGSYSKGMDSAQVAKCLREGTEIVLNGDVFSVKRVSGSGRRIVAESRRVVQPGQALCDFPAELVERLAGPCGLPRRDEEMFRSWAGRTGGFRSYEILGESHWCDEPAFGEPCDCVKVLLHL